MSILKDLTAGVPASFALLLLACGCAPSSTRTSVEMRAEAGRVVVRLGQARLDFVAIPAGTYRLGGSETVDERSPAEHPRDVTVAGFWIATTETTVAFWRAVDPATAPRDRSNDTLPMTGISWDRCQAFLTRLNAATAATGWRFRLPTEAEWEYACRAGATGAWHGPNLDVLAWTSANSGYRPHPVAMKQANAWGLYDCHGNAYEWCQDIACDLATGVPYDDGRYRILRGGSCLTQDWDCRAARRWWSSPGSTDRAFGCRLVAERVATVP